MKQLKFNYAHVEVKWRSTTIDEQDSLNSSIRRKRVFGIDAIAEATSLSTNWVIKFDYKLRQTLFFHFIDVFLLLHRQNVYVGVTNFPRWYAILKGVAIYSLILHIITEWREEKKN